MKIRLAAVICLILLTASLPNAKSEDDGAENESILKRVKRQFWDLFNLGKPTTKSPSTTRGGDKTSSPSGDKTEDLTTPPPTIPISTREDGRETELSRETRETHSSTTAAVGPGISSLPTDDEDFVTSSGSGSAPSHRLSWTPAGSSSKPKYYRISMVVMEPYHVQYGDPSSKKFELFAQSFTRGINDFYEDLEGDQSSRIVKIHPIQKDTFSMRVSFDLSSIQNSNSDEIKRHLMEKIKLNKYKVATHVVKEDELIFNEFGVCSDGEVSCLDNDQCVPQEARCDGNYDCADESDESGCPSTTPKPPTAPFTSSDGTEERTLLGRLDDHKDANQHHLAQHREEEIGEERCDDSVPCPSANWIHICADQICDGRRDCPEGTDERNCTTQNGFDCGQGEFMCDRTRCIPAHEKCDGIEQCEDRTDELNCYDKNQGCDFRCNNGTCLKYHQRCNAIPDCPDREDEQGCQNQCSPPTELYCQDRKGCYSQSQRCDGHYDCDDYSDEANCDDTVRCSDDEIMCRDRRHCYSSYDRCDGERKCDDGDDEENCSQPGDGCLPSEFRCNNGECTATEHRCDGIRDCNDGSDEENCGGVCSDKDLICDNGRCIKKFNICDGVRDCDDGADEKNCKGDCSWSEFECDSGECIPLRLKCNRRSDCNDGSDERDCSYQPDRDPGVSRRCSLAEYRCLSGDQCIPVEQFCDGISHCQDRSDEDNCASSPSLNLKTYPQEQTIKESREVVFQCRDEGPGHVPVRWSRDGLPLPQNSRDIRGRLEIPNIQLHHAGTYYCEAIGVPINTPGARVPVYLNVEPFVAPTSYTPVCGSDQATCHNRECIPRNAVCDGKIDCADGSDESRCSPFGCEPNEFQCDNKKCVRLSWLCDKDDDCGDGSDERNCQEKAIGARCFKNEFECKSRNQCIPKWFHCDDHNDCQDRSDEMGCYPMKFVQTPQSVIILDPGQSLVLTCKADGVPTPIISWRLNWHHVPSKCRSTSEDGFGTLTCPNMQEQDQGAYTCEALDFRHSKLAPDTHVIVRPIETQCPLGSFNDAAASPQECINCFCCGHTTSCRSANYSLHQLSFMDRVKFLSVYVPDNQGAIEIRPNEESNFQFQPRIFQNSGFQVTMQVPRSQGYVYPYFFLSNDMRDYHPNQLKSYGGYLQYRVKFSGPGQAVVLPDVILSGNNYTLTYIHPERIIPGRENQVKVRFFPGHWKVNRYGRTNYATRQDIMMALMNVDYLLIRVIYLSGSSVETSLSDIKMDSAGTRGSQGRTPFVEHCSCPAGYEGDSCERCSDGYVKVDTGSLCGRCEPYVPPIQCNRPGYYQDLYRNCKPCPCPTTTASNQFATTCRLDTDGQPTCDCPAGYYGRRCESCAPGYTGNPLAPGGRCTPLGECDEAGSISPYPDPRTGQCRCKANTVGDRCDQCAENSFSLLPNNQHGCISCFCMAISEECTSSNLYRDELRVEFTSGVYGFSIAPIDDLLDMHNVSFSPATREITFANFHPKIYYWVLPAMFLGDKVTSYGGYLRYTLRYVPTPGGQSSRNNAPDVRIYSLNNLVLVHRSKETLEPGVETTISVPLLEQHWTREDGGEVDRAHLLMALADLSAIYIKATYTTNSREAALRSVSLDIASSVRRSGSQRAVEVEQCNCPVGYIGTSCEDCDAGYTRTEDGLYLRFCEPCNCNNHSNNCHPETGECEYCSDNTMGPHCEECLPGFEHNSEGRCEPTGDTCDCDPRGVSGPCYLNRCQCKVNVIGDRCDRCRPGTFGLTESRAEGCFECYCSGLTPSCQASNLYREKIPTLVLDDNHGFTLHYSPPFSSPFSDRTVIRDGFTLNYAYNEVGYTLPRRSSQKYFWSLPSSLTGDKVTSYGGKLTFKLRFTGPSRITLVPDTNIMIQGNGLTLFRHFDSYTYMDPDYPKEFVVDLIDDGQWKIMKPLNSKAEASRIDMLKVLSNIESIMILASLDPSIETTHISDVSMDTAVPARRGEEAHQVEVCRCPPEYKGTSCQLCNDHYYRHYDDSCRSCPCNGNEESCSLGPDNQVKCNCRPGFSGNACQNVGVPSLTLPTTQPPPQEPTILITISEQKINFAPVGATVRYNCSAVSVYPQRRVEVNWVKEGGDLPSRAYEQRGLLIITSVREEDSGVYICTARDGYTSLSESITLTVGGDSDYPPAVSINPSDSVDVREGEMFEVRCQASGSPRPSYSWSRADNTSLNLQIIQYDGILRFRNIRREDSGVYVCTARNRVSSAIQYINIQVREYSGPTLSASPRRFTGVEGDTATITCSAPRNVYRLVWSRSDNRPLPLNARDNNGTLIIYGLGAADSGVYICSAIDSGRRIAETEAIIEVGNYRQPPPNPVISPERQTVPQGHRAEIRCTVNQPGVNIKWSKREEPLPSHIQVQGGVLKIPAVRMTDRGMYICLAESPSGQSQHYAILEVERREAPTIDLYPRSQQTLIQGTSTLLQCRVTSGIPTPTVYWTRPGNASIPYNIQQMPNGVLRFNSVSVSDGGEYICHAHNSVGEASATAQVVVHSIPKATVSPRGPLQLSSGDVLKIECTATGHPTPIVMWSRHHSQTTPYPSGGLTPPTYEMAVYEDFSVGPEDEGLYICIARNDAGTSEVRVEVIINDGDNEIGRGPRPDDTNEVDEREILIMAGESNSINCHLRESGDKRVRFEWVRSDRRSLPDGSHQRNGVLYLNNVDQSAEGDYTCMLIDVDTGAILQQKETTVRVNYPPRITMIPARQVVRPGDNARIDCTAEGEQPIRISWEAMNRAMPPSVSTQQGHLLFQGITTSDAGKYVCKATNRIGEARSVAEVVVSEYESMRPLVKALDNRIETAEGSSVSLQCLADITMQMEWQREGHDSLPPNTMVHGNTLRLDSVAAEDSGRYKCTVVGPSGDSGFDYIDLSVTRAQNVRLRIAPSIDVIRVGNTVDLRCISVGVPHTMLRWTKVGDRLAPNVHVTHNVLRISDVRSKNAGVYRCSTRTTSGSMYEEDYILEVQGYDDVDGGDDGNNWMSNDSPAMELKTADVGNTITLTCKTNLEPPVTFTWTKHGQPLPSNAYQNQSQLVLSEVRGEDAGLYWCKMENGEVSMEKPTMVTISGLIPSFHQNPISYIALPMLLDANVYFDIELLFRPDHPEGLILYNGQQEGGGGDFISVGLKEGKPEFRFDVGSGPGIITAPKPIALGSWHKLKLVRQKKQGEMWIDGEGPYKGQSGGRYQGLDLDRPLYLGSVPDFEQINKMAGFTQGFIGCISEMKVGGVSKSIDKKHSLGWEGVGDCDTCRNNGCTNNGACQQANNHRGYICLCPRGFSDENCTKLGESCFEGACGLGECVEAERGIKCKCPIDKTGERCENHVSIKTPQFSSNSYIAYPLSNQPNRVKMTVKFNAADDSDGILVYSSSDDNKFVALVIKQRHLEFIIDQGQGIISVETESEVVPNEWDIVTAGLDDNGAYIQFRNKNNLQRGSGFRYGSQRGGYGSLLYLGGIDSSVQPNPAVGVYRGFKGCVSSIDVYGQSLKIIRSAKEASEISECSVKESTCRGNPCRNGGSCTISGNSQSCICLPGYSGYYCEIVVNACETASKCENDGHCEPLPGGNHKCICYQGFGGHSCNKALGEDVSFSGDGWVELSSDLMEHADATQTELIEIEFSTSSSEGLLLWQGQSTGSTETDFIAVAIVSGELEVRFDLGSGEARIRLENSAPIDDGLKHTLVINRTATDAILTLDGRVHAEGSSPGFLSQLNTPGDIYIGGAPDIETTTRGRYSHGFTGCIHKLRLPERSDIDFGQLAVRTVNALPCSNDDENAIYDDEEEEYVF